MSNTKSHATLPLYSLTNQEIQSQSGTISGNSLGAHTDVRAGGYTCWWDTREGAEKCCAQHKHAGPVEKIQGSYTCYVDRGTWDAD